MKDSFFEDVILKTLGALTFATIIIFLIVALCAFVIESVRNFDKTEKTLILSEDIQKRVVQIENMLGIEP
jgi:hypothetical protein